MSVCTVFCPNFAEFFRISKHRTFFEPSSHSTGQPGQISRMFAPFKYVQKGSLNVLAVNNPVHA
jgi:hypothetical protein